MNKFHSIIFLFFVTTCLSAQSIDHWESIVLAEQNWKYFLGTSEPNSNWKANTFNDNAWLTGQGGIGYGDDDDNTVIAPVLSIYMRKSFNITDLASIEQAVLHADYDDAFVAYLNGVEIARANIGTVGDTPAYNTLSDNFVEPRLVNGELPIPFSISKTKLNDCLIEGTNTLAIQIHNHSNTSSDLSSIFYLSVGVSNSGFTYFPTPSWFTLSFNSSNLPIIVINSGGTNIPDEPKIDAHMGIIDNGLGNRNNLSDPYNNYDGDIAIEIRGASSQSFPKKGYGFETRLPDGENNNVELLGMPEENDWVLHGPYTDKSLMRNVLSYHISRQMGNYAPRTRFCELVINDQYLGVYVLTEKIKRDSSRVDISKLRTEDIEGDELTGGYILQIDRNNDDGWSSSFPDFLYYAYHYPDPDDMAIQQQNYIQNYITEFESAMDSPNYIDPVNGYSKYIDIDAFIDYWISNELAKEVDSYRLSFYMYKMKDSKGGKLHMGPVWDMNLSYGNFDYCDQTPMGWAHEFNVTCGSPLPFWMNKLLNVPAIQNQINCRWQTLRQTVLTTNTLIEYIDSTAQVLDEAQERNFEQWNVLGQYIWPNSFIGNSYVEEINFLKSWLVNRLNWMDNNMLGTCETTTTANFSKANDIDIFPNPFSENLHINIKKVISEHTELNIYDIFGQLLFSYPIPINELGYFTIDREIKQLLSGILVYEVRSKNGILKQGKLIKH